MNVLACGGYTSTYRAPSRLVLPVEGWGVRFHCAPSGRLQMLQALADAQFENAEFGVTGCKPRAYPICTHPLVIVKKQKQKTWEAKPGLSCRFKYAVIQSCLPKWNEYVGGWWYSQDKCSERTNARNNRATLEEQKVVTRFRNAPGYLFSPGFWQWPHRPTLTTHFLSLLPYMGGSSGTFHSLLSSKKKFITHFNSTYLQAKSHKIYR